MIRHQLAPILLLLLGGCISVKGQFSYHHLGDEVEDIQVTEACEEIARTGEIYELLETIREDHEQVIRILGTEKPSAWLPSIEELGEQIKMNSSKVVRLTKDEWNVERVEQEITWHIGEKDVRNFPGRPGLHDPRPLEVFFSGGPRKELLKQIQVTQEGNDIWVRFRKRSTLLEYCQLSRTLMIVFELKYRGVFGIKKKIFNLHVNKGVPL